MAKVFAFEDYKVLTSHDLRTTAANHVPTENDITRDTAVVQPKTSQASMEDLYPLSSQMRPELARAWSLLDEGLAYIGNAIKSLQEHDDVMASDDAIMNFQALLPELFFCRTIGEGFTTIITSVNHAIVNFDGAPLTIPQLKSLNAIIRRLRTEIYISDDEANDEVIKLQEIGFRVDPKYISSLVEILTDESIR
jgi:hypothetical protein